MFAQSAPEGRIAGIVKDTSGAVVPGAAIVVTNDNTTATFNTTSSAEGTFTVPNLPAGSYTVKITAKGFATAQYKQVMVEVGKEYSLTATMKIGQASETVDVVAGQELVNTTSADVTATITASQVNNLPLNGRDIISMIQTQAGVTYNGRTNTVINGGRPSWSQVTLDGVNIQDLYIRTNALDYIPNRPTTDTVQEFSINTSGQGSDAALGSTSVRMVTPSGSNDYHGGVWWYNRQNALAANDWFNNHYGDPKPFYLNNEFGGKAGGHIIKNKLFFYGYYEGIRERTAAEGTRYIPMNDDYKTGVYRYEGGPAGGVNLFTLMNNALANNTLSDGVTPAPVTGTLSVDPRVKAMILDKIDPASRLGSTPVPGDNFNYAGYRFPQLNNYPRDNYGTKIDYNPTDKHHFDFTYSYLHELFWRPDIDAFDPAPRVTNDSKVKLFTGAWRYNISNSLINSIRFGKNDAPAPFLVSAAAEAQQVADGFFFGGTAGLTSPQLTFMRQGRYPHIYQAMDDATYVKGNHYLSFGGQFQQQAVPPYNAAGIIPTLNTGLPTTTSAPYVLRGGLTNKMFTDAGYAAPPSLGAANSLLAFLSGLVASESQTFNVASATSGFVAGQQRERNIRIRDLSFYATDKWRIRPNLTITYGAKWEYISPYHELNGIQVGPIYDLPNDPIASLMDPNGKVGFKPEMYAKQYGNLGPSVGFAWDPFKDGKTSIRGGYSLTFVNDEIIGIAGNAADGNAGLSSTVSLSGLYSTLSGVAPYVTANGAGASGVYTVPTPAFKMPRTFADQLGLSRSSAVWAVDPKIKMPKVHEVNFGFERELPKDIGVSVRYVGTLGHSLLRGIDFNQDKAATNPAFMQDFIIARTNGYLAQAAGKSFSGAYDSTVVGSRPLTYLTSSLLGNAACIAAGTCNSPFAFGSNINPMLQQNAVTDLADFYTYYRNYYPGAPSVFLPNPGIYAVDYATNGAFSSYHSMQAEARRRFKGGLQFQANYVWSKLLTDTPTGGTSQSRFDPYLDNARKFLNKGRANFDLRHALKGNMIFEMPFGKGKMMFANAGNVVDKVIGGWQLSTIAFWQSGSPFSFLDGRGTFNRGSLSPVGSRSGLQTAITNLPNSEIKKLFGFFENTNTGAIYYINPKVINPVNGRAVSQDTLLQTPGITTDPTKNFQQIFFHPGPGQVGNMQPLYFDGPAYWNIDLGLQKNFKVTERVSTLFRIDAFNVLNHTTFYEGDQSITSSSFGQIFYTNTTNRRLQLSLRINF